MSEIIAAAGHVFAAGSPVPFVVIGGGIAGAIALFFATKEAT
jgi:hypothetical protein